MPPPRLPLTPASSTEIAAMDKASGAPGELYFSLPPAALSPSQRKKRSASDIDLPPPPTRSRKIIQMKPKQDVEAEETSKTAKAKDSGAGKKKQSASTAAGRKIARKTAHSLIERRRRSKMNEEFATLKDMIPACRGQDMHKLAILQASIEYMNYLEQCVADLKAANASKRNDSLREWTGPSRHEQSPTTSASSPETSPAISPLNSQPQTQLNAFPLHFTPPETSTNINISRRNTAFDMLPNPMVLPSPSLSAQHEPQFSRRATADYTYAPTNALPPLSLNTTSPHIRPLNQPPSTRLDHEASAALLMLNSHDRREETQTHQGRSERKSGISVHDLLSH